MSGEGPSAIDVETEPSRHPVEWTPERIREFWSYYASNDALQDTYFSNLRGRSLVEFVSRRIPIGTALDMGCGRGDLIGYLMEAHNASGSDQSPDSVGVVTERFQGHPRFLGGFVGTSGLKDGHADTV